MALSAETIAVVKATAPVVAEHALEITSTFYPLMFKRNPEALAFFNKTNQVRGKQREALANAVVAYASNIENLGVLGDAVEAIAHKHCGLNVLPAHYSIVEENLMMAIGQVLGDAVTPEIGAAWTEAVKALSQILIAREEELYSAAEKRMGGWRGWKGFKIAQKTALADDTALLRLVPVEAQEAGFDFTPGQFLSINCTIDQGNPRHYTVVSPPGAKYFDICVRLARGTTGGSGGAGEAHPDGVVSSWLHAKNVGDVVDVAPPFGVFNLEHHVGAAAAAAGANVLFVSAGVGITPIRAFAHAMATSPKGASNFAVLHQDHRRSSHAFVEEMEMLGGARCAARYSEHDSADFSAGHLDVADIEATLAKNGFEPANTTLVLCGPSDFMQAIAAAKESLGVRAVIAETFGPQLATTFAPSDANDKAAAAAAAPAAAAAVAGGKPKGKASEGSEVDAPNPFAVGSVCLAAGLAIGAFVVGRMH